LQNINEELNGAKLAKVQAKKQPMTEKITLAGLSAASVIFDALL
jgi:hypothetical protein